MHDVIRLHLDVLSSPALQPHMRVATFLYVFVRARVLQGCEYIYSSPGEPALPLSHRNFQTSACAEFSSSLLTVDCKCPNLGRQPFLIMRITLLSNRKIKLNNTIAYSWSQTAALRTHQSPLKLFHAPPSTHTHTHLHTHIHTHIHTQKQETAVSSPLWSDWSRQFALNWIIFVWFLTTTPGVSD